MSFELVTLKSGIISLRSLENRETFHPVTGPKAEANILHVKQQRLVERSAALTATGGTFVIWDVGFGAAANVLATIEALKGTGSRAEIHSFDKTTAPLEFALTHADELGYFGGHEKNLHHLISDRDVEITPHLRWKLHLGDFRETVKGASLPAPHAIIYDPYSPVGNPEMWTQDHFTRVRNSLNPDVPCLLTNYTRSTAVRVTLLLAGFFVGIGCEVGEKAETTIASNRLELLERPLEQSWLDRVRISRNSAPMTGPAYSQACISDEDFARLNCRPQFQPQSLR
ncbi:MAG: MnmC family methyltransferase [Oligoflexia bacterium]|nr:MnmC family methyltransferase [Oligoflexia bacterium]